MTPVERAELATAYLSTKELAAYLGMSVDTARKIMREAGIWMGNRYKIRRDVADRWLARTKDAAQTGPCTRTTTATSGRRKGGSDPSRRIARISARRRKKLTDSKQTLRERAAELNLELYGTREPCASTSSNSE